MTLPGIAQQQSCSRCSATARCRTTARHLARLRSLTLLLTTSCTLCVLSLPSPEHMPEPGSPAMTVGWRVALRRLPHRPGAAQDPGADPRAAACLHPGAGYPAAGTETCALADGNPRAKAPAPITSERKLSGTGHCPLPTRYWDQDLKGVSAGSRVVQGARAERHAGQLPRVRDVGHVHPERHRRPPLDCRRRRAGARTL